MKTPIGLLALLFAVVSALPPTAVLAIEEYGEKSPAMQEERKVQERLPSEEARLAQVEQKKGLEQIFGKVVDVKIEGDRTTLTLGKPEEDPRTPGVQSAEREMRFALDKNASIKHGARAVDPTHLKVGQHVQLSYSERWFGGRIAQSILIK